MTAPILLDQILAPGGLRPMFQPIYRLKGDERTLHGLECLTRGPRGTNAESAGVLFEYVRRKREEIIVDRSCILAAFCVARDLAPSTRLSVNAHASTLARDPAFPQFLEDSARRHGITAERLTLEIVEHGPALDVPSFSAALDELRLRRMRIALDDVGVGTSTLRMMLDCKPDYFKIDRHFVNHAQADAGKRATLEAVTHIARRVGAEVVAEGVETEDELAIVREVGIELVQGWHFCPALELNELLEREPSLIPPLKKENVECLARKSL
jgi:EAL domain-containing protein (putative c-di-GMP-specific phosphodiesterase class I)